MPSTNRPAEHARHTVERLLRGVPIPIGIRRSLLILADTMEAGKSQLRGHLGDRKAQVEKLSRDLNKARATPSDDRLIELYAAGSNLLTKQADEIKKLKGELQPGKDEREKSERNFALKLAEKDKHIAQVEVEKDVCREALRRLETRLAALESVKGANSNIELAKLKQHVESYRSMVDEQKQHIDKLTLENAKLAMALGRQHLYELDLP